MNDLDEATEALSYISGALGKLMSAELLDVNVILTPSEAAAVNYSLRLMHERLAEASK